MVRWLFIGVVAVVVLTIYAVADCAFFDRMRIRGIGRGWWIVVIIFVPVIGAVLWFAIGRGRRSRSVSGGRGYTAPDDDTDFLRRLGQDAEQDERIRRLEQELAELDSEPEPPGGDDDQHPAGPGATRPENPETPGEAGPSGRPNA